VSAGDRSWTGSSAAIKRIANPPRTRPSRRVFPLPGRINVYLAGPFTPHPSLSGQMQSYNVIKANFKLIKTALRPAAAARTAN